MHTKNKLITIICSLMIGVLFIIAVFVGLILGDVISIKRVKLEFMTGSAEAIYDSMPLTNHNWYITKGKLKEGHTIEVSFSGTQTNVGESQNIIEIRIKDELGADVTSDYDIVCDFGTLKINPRSISIGVKDGATNISLDALTVLPEGDGLVKGDYIIIDTNGIYDITDITDMSGISVKVYSYLNKDVTNNYQINLKAGLFGALGGLGGGGWGDIDGPGGGGSGGGNGTGGGGSGGGGGGDILGGGSGAGMGDGFGSQNPDQFPDDEVLYIVYSNTDDFVYLRMGSFGQYNGRGWDTAPVYGQLIENRYAATYLTSVLLMLNNAKTGYLKIKPCSQHYVLPYYPAISMDMDTIQSNDTEYIGDIDKQYQVTYLKYDDSILSYAGKNPIVALFEEDYRSFVYDNYLDIDDETLNFMRSIIKTEKFSTGDPDIINKVAMYIKNAATYNLEFDPTLEESDNIAIAFLRDYKEGVCRHYATAATLLYRALGIPARYTVGVATEVYEGEWTEVKSSQGHAWVEVYLDGIGWVNVEVTGASPDGGAGSLSPGLGGGACDGSCEGDCDGSCSGIGNGKNPGGDNPGGDNPGGDNPGGDNPGGDNPGGDNPGGDNPGGDNPGGDNPGGDNPGGDNPGGDNPGGDNPGGDNPGGDNPGGDNPGGDNPGGDNPGGDNPGGDNPGGDNPGGDNPGGDNPGGDNPGGDNPGGDNPGGDTPGGDNPGGDNPGGNTPNEKKELVLAPKSVRKEYDGSPLYAEPILEGFNDLEKLGFFYYVEVSGERTELGVSYSKIENIAIYDSNGNNVTDSFKLTLNVGRIHVYSSKLTFRSENYSKQYDGIPTATYCDMSGELIEGHECVIEFDGQVNVGTWSNAFKVTIVDAEGNDVTAYYYVEKIYGNLTITSKEITVKAGDATKRYDGSPLTCDSFSIVEGMLAEGHEITSWNIVGSQTAIGRSDNIISNIVITDEDGNDVTSNYTIVMKPGKLKVTVS